MSPVTTKNQHSQFVPHNEVNEPDNPVITSYYRERNAAIPGNVLDTNSLENSKFNSDKTSSDSDQKQNINWSLQFLADLESTPIPHRRFTSLEQLENLFAELER